MKKLNFSSRSSWQQGCSWGQTNFDKRFDGYVEELATPCQVYGLDGMSIGCEAIWDTGAEDSVISPDVAKKLK